MDLRSRTTKYLFFSFCLIVLERSAEPAYGIQTYVPPKDIQEHALKNEWILILSLFLSFFQMI